MTFRLGRHFDSGEILTNVQISAFCLSERKISLYIFFFEDKQTDRRTPRPKIMTIHFVSLHYLAQKPDEYNNYYSNLISKFLLRPHKWIWQFCLFPSSVKPSLCLPWQCYPKEWSSITSYPLLDYISLVSNHFLMFCSFERAKYNFVDVKAEKAADLEKGLSPSQSCSPSSSSLFLVFFLRLSKGEERKSWKKNI